MRNLDSAVPDLTGRAMLALPTKGAWRPDFAPVPNFFNVLASSMDRRPDLRFRLLNFFERTGTVVWPCVRRAGYVSERGIQGVRDHRRGRG